MNTERTALYAEIKSLNCQDYIKENYGKNYTNLSTNTLKEAIASYNKFIAGLYPTNKKEDMSENIPEETPKDINISNNQNTEESLCEGTIIYKLFKKLIDILRKKHILLDSELNELTK